MREMSFSPHQVRPVRQQSLPQPTRSKLISRRESMKNEGSSKQLKIFSRNTDFVLKPDHPKMTYVSDELKLTNAYFKNPSSAPNQVGIISKRLPCNLSRNACSISRSAIITNHLNDSPSYSGNSINFMK